MVQVRACERRARALNLPIAVGGGLVTTKTFGSTAIGWKEISKSSALAWRPSQASNFPDKRC